MSGEKLVMILLALLAVFALVFGSFIFFPKNQSGEPVAHKPLISFSIDAAASPDRVEEEALPEPDPVPNEPSNWQVYDNKEVGFSFKYPPEFGELRAEIIRNDNEYKFRASNAYFAIGAMTDGFEPGRGDIVDFVRFEKSRDRYFRIGPADRREEFVPEKILFINGEEVPVLQGVAYINLPSKSYFRGLAVWDFDARYFSQEKFETMLSTFSFYKN